MYNQFTSNPSTFLAILLSIGVAVTVEYAIRRSTGRGFRVRHHHAAG